MKIFRVLGLALAIIILRVLMPEIFGAFEHVLLKFFTLINSVLSFVQDSFSDGSFLPAASSLPTIPR